MESPSIFQEGLSLYSRNRIEARKSLDGDGALDGGEIGGDTLQGLRGLLLDLAQAEDRAADLVHDPRLRVINTLRDHHGDDSIAVLGHASAEGNAVGIHVAGTGSDADLEDLILAVIGHQGQRLRRVLGELLHIGKLHGGLDESNTGLDGNLGRVVGLDDVEKHAVARDAEGGEGLVHLRGGQGSAVEGGDATGVVHVVRGQRFLDDGVLVNDDALAGEIVADDNLDHDVTSIYVSYAEALGEWKPDENPLSSSISFVGDLARDNFTVPFLTFWT